MGQRHQFIVSSQFTHHLSDTTPQFSQNRCDCPRGRMRFHRRIGQRLQRERTQTEGLGGMLFRATASGRTVWRLRNLRGIEMRKTTKILNLATALSALVVAAVAPEIANASNSDEADIAEASGPRAEKNTEIKPRREDLMGFTVHQNSDGMMVPQHGSHASHASHASSSY
jgi:hypothetical protein